MAKPKNQKQAPKPAAAPVEKIAGKVRDLSGIVDRIRARVKNSGFIRDALDPRDFCASRLFPRGLQLPISTANRPNYSPVEDQSTLGSCTAQAGVGIAEMLDRLPDGAHVDLSRLALYFFEREAMGTVDEDSGATIRECMKQLAIGVPPESLWPYDIAKFKDAPPQEAVDARGAHRIAEYYRVPALRQQYMAKAALARGLPVICGILVYESMMTPEVAETGKVPYPVHAPDLLVGGHAIVLVDYDDMRDVFIFRNSWGEDWGDGGYGTLPQSYISSPRLTSDMWVATKAEIAEA